MKNFNTIPTAIVLGLLSISNASATNAGVDAIPAEQNNVIFQIDDGVATLTGTVEDDFEKQTMETAARKIDGVEEVRNYLTVSK